MYPKLGRIGVNYRFQILFIYLVTEYMVYFRFGESELEKRKKEEEFQQELKMLTERQRS